MENLQKWLLKVPWWIYVAIGISAVILVDMYARSVGTLTITTYLVNLAGVALVIAWAFPMAYATSPNYYGPGFLGGILMSILSLGVSILFFGDEMTAPKGAGCIAGTLAVLLFTTDKQVQRNAELEARWLKRIRALPAWAWLAIACTPFCFIGRYPWWGYVLIGAATTTLIGFYARLIISPWKAYKVNMGAVALITAWCYPLAYIKAPTFFQAGLLFMIVAAVLRISVGAILLKNRFTQKTGAGCILAVISSLLLLI